MSVYLQWSFVATLQGKEGKPREKTDYMWWKMYAPNVTFGSLTIFTATAKHILSWLSRGSKAITLHASIRTYLCFVWLDDIKHWFSSLSVAVKAGCVHASLGLLESTHQWGSLLFGNHGHRNYQNRASNVVLLGVFPACNLCKWSLLTPGLSCPCQAKGCCVETATLGVASWPASSLFEGD